MAGMASRVECIGLTCALTWAYASGAAGQAQTAPDAQTQAEAPAPAPCSPSAPRRAPLTADESAACRKLWQDDIAAARLRQQAYQQAAIEAFAARKSRQKVEGPVALETFVGDDSMNFGDIIVLDDGPRVYVGRAYQAARPEDFVALDAPRSPHRKRAADMLKALRR